MMENRSPSSNDSSLLSHISTSNFELPSEIYCLFTHPAMSIFTVFNVVNICLLVPLCVFILHHGFKQFWSNKESTVALSHSDCIIYHLSVIEVFGVFGNILNLCGTNSYQPYVLAGGLLLITFTLFGETFFHALTCVERYLAVVHPITYRGLRSERGIRIRNVIIVCVWLLCVFGTSLLMIERLFIAVNICVLAFTLPIVFFCSVSVLCALIRSGPGERGGDKQRVDPIKKKAFYTIMAILGVLMLRFGCGMVWGGMFTIGTGFTCVVVPIDVWFNLPSSLILPLLFLHRTGTFCFIFNP